MTQREQTIRACFHSWIAKDLSAFLRSFSDAAVYVESWGPAYQGPAQLKAWFTDWNRDNDVLRWEIQRFFHVEDTSLCEWRFQCDCGGTVSAFDGVSVITFDEAGKIVFLKEYQSKTPNCYPYGAAL